MVTSILDHIDFEKVNALLEGFNKTTGFVTAILDLEGNVLSKSGWRQICTGFHRINPETSKKCTISDTVLAGKLAAGEKYHFYKCMNGLVDVAVPIVIKGEHIANLFSGQFFFEEPDINFFDKQAEKYGFDKSIYLKALGDVPVVSEEKVKTAMDFLLNMTQMISEMTFQKLEQMELTEAIQKSEAYNRMLFEQSAIGLALTSLEGKLIDINPTYANIIGRTIDEAKKLTYWEITPEKYLGQEQQLLKNLNEIGYYGPYEKEYIHKDGHFVPVRLQGKIIERAGVKYIWSSVEDITERKLAEEKLRESEEKFRTLIMAGSDSVYRMSPDWSVMYELDGRGFIIDTAKPNAAWFQEYIPPDDQENVMTVIQEAIRTKSLFELEHRVWRVDGSLGWTFSRAIPRLDANGEIFEWFGAASDVTDRKQSEEKLQENYALLRIAGEKAKLGGWSVNLEENRSYWSDQVATIHEMPIGYSPLVEDGINFYAPEWRDKITEVFTRCAQEGISYDEEMEIITSTEKRVWVRTIGEAATDDRGKIVKVNGAFQDITERKQAEAEIRNQLDELRRWYEVTLDREGRVMQLKQEVNELLKQHGEALRYGSAIPDNQELE